MSTLEDLRKQRATLNNEIAQREKEEADAWDDRLDELSVALYTYATHQSVRLETRDRKNVTTLRIDDRVDVELGYHDSTRPDWGTWFGVATGKMRISFDNGLPTSVELVGLIDGLLFPERWRTQ